MTAWYNKSDSLPSSPASTAAGLADLSPTDSDIDIERYESVNFRAKLQHPVFYTKSLCHVSNPDATCPHREV